MNETIKTLLSRRSIRKYKAEQIKDEELQAVLEAGMYAPSARNRQSPLFVAVQDKEMLKKLDDMNKAVNGATDPQYFNAPTVILVFGDKNVPTYIQDASLALGNMFNAAASLGLGSCWVNREKEMFETEEGRALMKEWGVPDNYEGVGACTLGYPEGPIPEAKPRKDNYVIYVK
ncbi:MAG: diguanylate cyclase [Clostridiales bacterium]|nr:diguanylate cyclase [Clostridiales bacterium]